MSLVVNTVISSLTSRRALQSNNLGADVAFQRLSSGFRINSAADDAAGLQISNRLTGQIEGLSQAVRNANDGISLAQVAESALDEITVMAQRMRTFVVQSRSGVNSLADKQALQREIGELNKEITRVASSTEFGGTKLLDGSLNKNFLVGANAGEHINVSLQSDEGFTAEALWLSEIVVDGSDGIDQPRKVGSNNPVGTTFTLPDPPLSGTVYGLEASVNGGEFFSVMDPTGSPYGPPTPIPGQISFGSDTDTNLMILGTALNLGSGGDFQGSINFASNSFTSINGASVRFRVAGDAVDLADAHSTQAFVSNLTGFTPQQVGLQGFELIPAEEEEAIASMNLQIIDQAIQTIDAARAGLGAVQNRFQSTIRNISNVAENASAARSQIKDTDYARETAELTRRQILVQASTTMLAQANQRSGAALSLLN